MNTQQPQPPLNGAQPAIPDELFTFTNNAGGMPKPLREASDAELASAEEQFKQQLALARNQVAEAILQAGNFGQLVAVILFERERRAKSIVIAKTFS